jgi:hypothetical protein
VRSTETAPYQEGGCLNLTPIGVNELARLAKVAPASASDFFKKQYKRHGTYKVLCPKDVAGLAASIKLLNGEYSPHQLFGRNLPGEGANDDAD